MTEQRVDSENMSDGNSYTVLSLHGSSVAHREFCYRWTCDCGHENRVGEIVAGKSNVCRACNKAVRIKTIVYDNGAIGHIG